MSQKKQTLLYGVFGLGAGLLNGFFGAGGGTLLVPALEHFGLESKKAHATSIAIILPLSVISALAYFGQISVPWQQALWFLPGGVIGALIGAKLLPRVRNQVLHRIFGAIIIASAVRLWMR